MLPAMLNRATIPVADGTDVSGMRAMRLLISLLSFGMFFCPISATAAVVTTSLWTQFSTTVTQPELINLGGAIHVVTEVTIPTDPCSPSDPCRAVPVTVHLNLAGVSGVGQTTGQRYRVTGATNDSASITMPGGFVASAAFQLIPPTPIIPPTAINVQVSLTADSSGNVTAPASQPQGLVSWWQAEGDATDALGVNNGTIQGTVSFVPGRVGQAFQFSGLSDVFVPDSPSLDTATVTVMAWVKHLGPPAVNTNAYVVSKGAQFCQVASYGIFTSPSTQNLLFGVSDGTNFGQSPDTGPANAAADNARRRSVVKVFTTPIPSEVATDLTENLFLGNLVS